MSADGLRDPETVSCCFFATEATMKRTPIAAVGAMLVCAGALAQDPSQETIARVQTTLSALGYSPGAADGRLTQQTAEALMQLQRARNLPATGQINQATLGAIGLASPTIATPGSPSLATTQPGTGTPGTVSPGTNALGGTPPGAPSPSFGATPAGAPSPSLGALPPGAPSAAAASIGAPSTSATTIGTPATGTLPGTTTTTTTTPGATTPTIAPPAETRPAPGRRG